MNPKLSFMLARQNAGSGTVAPDPAPLGVTKDEYGRITSYTIDGVPHTVTYSAGTMTWTDGTSTSSVSMRDLGDFVPTTKVFTSSTDALSFESFTGTNDTAQTFTIGVNDGSAVPITITEAVSWLTISPMSGTTPLTCTATVNQAALTASSTPYAGTLTATPTGFESQAMTIAAEYLVKAVPTASNFALLASPNSSRSSAVTLHGSTITGIQYIYVAEDPGILSVEFYLDNATPSAPTGTPFKTETQSPWDFNGTNTATGAPNPWDSTTISAASHTISAKINLTAAAGGGSVVVVGTFTRGGSATTITTSKKWNPGYYLNVGTNAGGVGSALSRIKTNNFKGVLVSQFWGNIETSLGVYNWTTIDSIMAQAATAKKQIFIKLPWVWFNQQNLVPSYVLTGTQYAGGISEVTVGSYKRWIKVWDADVRARLIAFFQAFATRYDGHPNLEGIIFNETFGPDKPSTKSNFTDFTVAGFIDGMKAIYTALNTAFPKTIIHATYNWNVYQDTRVGKYDVIVLLEHTDAIAGGMCIPDTIPGDAIYARSYLQARQNVRPMICSFQDKSLFPGIRNGTSYNTLFNYATSDPSGYKANYLHFDAWDDTVTTTPKYTVTNMINAVIAANYPCNTTIPTAIRD